MQRAPGNGPSFLVLNDAGACWQVGYIDLRVHAFRWRGMLTDLGVTAGMVSSQAGLMSSFRPPGQTFNKEENSYETFQRGI